MVPDGGTASVFGHGAFDLKRRGCRAPGKVIWKTHTRFDREADFFRKMGVFDFVFYCINQAFLDVGASPGRDIWMSISCSAFDRPAKAVGAREVVDLCGLWKLRFDPEDLGLSENWADGPTPPSAARPVAVPSSYNDLYAEVEVRDHVGPVRYERTFVVPPSWMT